MVVFIFFKQKTANEMRISDWSSDVCSSDLKEIERSVVINDASDRRRQFSNRTLGHRGIPKSAQCNAYQRVIDVGDNGVHIQLPRPILPGLFDPVAEATAPPCVQVGIHRSEEHTCEI